VISGKVAKPRIKQLRNYVYNYCLEYPHDHDVVVRRAPEGNDTNLFIREHIYQRQYSWIEDPISSYVSTQDLGLDTAGEMLQFYYWSRTFKFSSRALSLLIPFLETDMFGLGLIPAYYIRHLHIELHPHVWALSDLSRIEEQICFSTIEALGDALTSFTKITLHINLVEDMEDDMESVAMSEKAKKCLQRVEQIVQHLRGRSLRIEVIYIRTWDG
jgi:hypothetical protein